jgi:hypothetical protein
LDKVDVNLQRILVGMSKEQLVLAMQDDNWLTILRQAGLSKWLADYSRNYDKLFANQVGKIGISKVNQVAGDIDIVKSNMDLIKASNDRTIVGYQTQATELVRSKLISSIADGISSRVTTTAILNENPLHTPSQVGTIVNTAYADFQRTATAQIFKDKPEQRFKYEDVLIPTSSCQCKWLVLNQRKEGYTKAEIDKGISTPCTDSKGNELKIYWYGRKPNFNCIHEWLPIE